MPMDGRRHLLHNRAAPATGTRAAWTGHVEEPHACAGTLRTLDAVRTKRLLYFQEGLESPMEDVTTEAAPAPPFFDVHIFVCCNRRPDGHPRGSCAARGSEALRDYMKARVKEAKIPHARVNMAGCLDRCEIGPCIVIYPEGAWFRAETRDDVDAIIERHLIGGERAEALRLPPGRSG